ncbi:hypothetical protein F3Y22_tig00110833pilonHSYRG00285 [Hibiscus syriacus]|uniref:Uncharacterized protein n=1 Tax=Hibiscus syriacus TaxID=106335 RepID=A0A6A2ZN09_HIBSY|nr:hypothetical protein F3Y22_tig00110833pilonHSYRG00285 [Hibiscus syriacus]
MIEHRIKPLHIHLINGVGSSQADDEDTEISIFDAQRFFDETNTNARLCKIISPVKDPISSELRCDIPASALAGRFSSASSAADGYGYGKSHRARSFHATPTASSEASWNSQAGLLSNPHGAVPVSMNMKTLKISDQKTKGSGKMRWIWGLRCPCSGKKISAENIHRVIASATTRPPMIDGGSAGTTSGFKFPILINRNHNSLDDHNDPPRDPLEVFRPAEESNPKKPVARTSIVNDKVGSDTSSDLFEIESFSTSNPPCHRRDSLDEASSFNIRRSIGASGNVSGFSCMHLFADGRRVLRTERGEHRMERDDGGRVRERIGSGGDDEHEVGNGGGGERKRSGLLRCRWQKAVNVGPNPVKFVPPHGQAACLIKACGQCEQTNACPFVAAFCGIRHLFSSIISYILCSLPYLV